MRGQVKEIPATRGWRLGSGHGQPLFLPSGEVVVVVVVINKTPPVLRVVWRDIKQVYMWIIRIYSPDSP